MDVAFCLPSNSYCWVFAFWAETAVFICNSQSITNQTSNLATIADIGADQSSLSLELMLSADTLASFSLLWPTALAGAMPSAVNSLKVRNSPSALLMSVVLPSLPMLHATNQPNHFCGILMPLAGAFNSPEITRDHLISPDIAINSRRLELFLLRECYEQTFAIMAALGFMTGVCFLPVMLSIIGPASHTLQKVRAAARSKYWFSYVTHILRSSSVNLKSAPATQNYY